MKTNSLIYNENNLIAAPQWPKTLSCLSEEPENISLDK